MPESTVWGRNKFRFFSLLLILIVLAAFVVSAIAYNRGFESTIPVTLKADRAGLQMHPNNRVKIRGVDLGFVHSVQLNKDNTGVDIVLYLNPELAAQVPANATVSLDQLTAFGNKAIMMNYPANPSNETLHAGSVIETTHITTELNNTFDHLMTLLTEIQPAKLNATLGAFAQAVQGQGDSLGTTISKANNYLVKFNQNMPALQNDFRVTSGFSRVYADAAPDLVSLLHNASVTSRTISDRSVDFHGAIKGGDNVGGEIDNFFGTNANPLTDMLSSLRPTTSLLKEYSPEFTCFLDGAAKAYRQLNETLFPAGGIQFEAALAFGTAGEYSYPNDLPTVGPGPEHGPNCRGLPDVPLNNLSGTQYTTSPYGLRGRSNSPLQLPRQPAIVQFFGPNALMPASLKGGK
jgi:phospholipid/cholesterol/gamma-HCH transport system substrate-binding protein